MTSELFLGYALNAVDAKARVSVPASFREVIERRSDTRAMVVGVHERAPCLVGYDRRHAARLQAQMETRFASDFGDARDSFARTAFGLSEVVPYDETGRCVLPPMMRELGGIERQALFFAAGEYFEIWNPETLLEQPGIDPRMARLVRAQMASKA